MGRKLFCEIHPAFYAISVAKERSLRQVRNVLNGKALAGQKRSELLPVVVYRHKSLIRRRLANVDLHLQENKAISLALAAPRVNEIVIRPGETFSFWKLVGPVSARRGYREGLTISSNAAASGIGGGLCQFTNLIHWMVLHTPLEITEHHHHSGVDLFPDFNRQIPFGTGTSIIYNYLDYRFMNPTDQEFQLRTWVTEEYLCGELRAERALEQKFHIHEEDAYFYRSGTDVIRHNRIVRTARSKVTGNEILREELLENNATVVYDHALISAAVLDSRPEGAAPTSGTPVPTS